MYIWIPRVEWFVYVVRKDMLSFIFSPSLHSQLTRDREREAENGSFPK